MSTYDGSHETSITSTGVISLKSDGWDVKNLKFVNIKDPDSISDKQIAVTVNFGDNYYLFKKKPPTETSSTFSNVLEYVSINMNTNPLFGLPILPLIDSEAVCLGYL